MKRKVLSILLIFTLAGLPIYGQSIPYSEITKEGLEIIPQEKVFVHFNTSLLFPAEYLYYSVYCFDQSTNRLSAVSKIAYVELIGEDKNAIFKHKIRLEDGLGQGDFFIPVSVPSGNYKLIAYTNWMKNAGKDYFFQEDISIINPYQEDQKSILREVEVKIDSLGDTLEIIKPSVLKPVIPVKRSVGPIQLSVSRKNFGKRSKASFILKGKTAMEMMVGQYSVSVRKRSAIPKHPSKRSDNYGELYPTRDRRSLDGDVIFLPELRGELLSGKVSTNEQNASSANKKVAISLLGENYQFKIALTDNEGRFFVNLDTDYSGDEALVHIIGEGRNVLDVKLNQHSPVDYSNINFKKFKIDRDMEELILERSVHNQIESAYFGFRPDSILPAPKISPFSEANTRQFNLADYTPFKTVREVLLEIVNDAWVRRNKGQEEIEVKSMELVSNPYLLPILIVDGIIEQDHTKLLDYDASRVSSIKVIRDRYIFGPQIYQGALILETKNGDYSLDQNLNLTSIFKPQERKNYFAQKYVENSLSNEIQLPDDRLQLLWVPSIKMNESVLELDFYTSDVSGEYEICIEGFTTDGEPVSLRDVIVVE